VTPGPARGTRLCSLLAIGAYLLVALLWFRSVLPAPATRLPYPALLDAGSLSYLVLDHFDQAMVTATVIRNAHLLVTRPWDLFSGEGQCYPMARAYTLGEHMFGVGLLAALPYGATGDPILSYNFALVLTLWIPGISMYFFALRFTRQPPAAFVAGLAFALVPGRIIDPSHPYVHGDLWTPAVLLFLHRLFVEGRWRDAAGLALFSCLVVSESLYPLFSTAVLAGCYGLYLIARHPRRIGVVTLPLVAALAIAGLAVWLVLGPYLETRETWGLLGGRFSALLKLTDFAPGRFSFPGWVVSLLALLALVDRWRGPRPVHGEDPRLVLLVGGLLLVWFSIDGIPIPWSGIVVPSPFGLLRQLVPGLEAVRALSAVAIGAGLPIAFLAGFGSLVLIERFRPRLAIAVAAALCMAIMAFRFYSPLARWSFGRPLRMVAYDARPDEADIALSRSVGSAPQIDFPPAYADGSDKRLDVADHLLLASFSPRALGSCYNSFLSPVNRQVIALASALPDSTAADALAALGFATVFFHRERMSEDVRNGFLAGLDQPSEPSRLKPLGETDRITAYRLASPLGVSEDFSLLVPRGNAEGEPATALAPRDAIAFPITNHGSATFRHPKPLEPTSLVARWIGDGGRVVREDTVRALLPIALGAGATTELVLDLPIPEQPGSYVVTLARADAAGEPLSVHNVESVALESAMSPTEAMARRLWDFLMAQVMPRGMQSLAPPEDTVEMVLTPDTGAVSELLARGDLVLRLISPSRKPVGEVPLPGGVRVGADPRTVRAHAALPEIAGLHLAVLTAADRPERALAARVVLLPPPR
jgi:hypothetical protein